MRRRQNTELRQEKRKTFIARYHLLSLAIAAIVELIYHTHGVMIGLIAFLVFVAWMICALIENNGQARHLGLATLVTLVFFIFSILGDVMDPPSALCADRTYSYSAHRQGTCSWHGGVAQWNPPLWWEKFPF